MSVAQNFIHIQNQISKTARAWDVPPQNLNLIAVSKKQPDARIDAALATGHVFYGENRVQEAAQRWNDNRRANHPDIELHLIGPLQTNKAADAISLFDVIHTLDREKLARMLRKEMDKQEREIPCFIQVNTGSEDQKSGVLPVETTDFIDFCRGEMNLNIKGLMCIPPVDEPPAHHFALLYKLAKQSGLSALSMGMSGDFERAIPFGKDMQLYIRVGSALFGEREEK